jgi:hypothetical protein
MRRLIAALVALVLLAGCGGGEDAEQALEQTFRAGRAVESGRLDLALRVQTDGRSTLPRPLALRLRGPFVVGEGRAPGFDLDVETTIEGRPLRLGAVSTGRRGFVTVGGEAYSVDARTFARLGSAFERARTDARGVAGERLARAGVDPRRWLRAVEDRGTEELDGTTVRRLSGQVDVARLLADLDRLVVASRELGAGGREHRLGPLERRVIEESVERARVDVWTGEEDRVLRRLALDVRFGVPADQRGEADGLERGALRLDLAYRDVNEPQVIRAPREARPSDELAAALARALAPRP